MQIVRMIVWVLLLTALLVFSFANWNPPVVVSIWPNLVMQTKIPAIVVVSFLIGFVPMWLVYRATRWQHHRRIASLESGARHTAPVPPPAPVASDPVASPAEHPVPPLRERLDEPPPGL